MSRIADAVVAVLLLTFALPLMIIVAIAIKWDSPGPIFERETCIGRRGRRFRMLQFRTTAYAPDRPISGRPELTPVGAVLRYTRIDTLPQLLNVLLGHISIIELDGRWRSF